MAKYSQTTQNADGNYESRVYTDYTQTAAEGVGKAAGIGLVFVLSLIFMSKLTIGGTLVLIGLLSASGGWGWLSLLCGGGFIAWWFHDQSQAREQAEREEAHQRRLRAHANREAQRLAEEHSTPPVEPVVALSSDELDLTRFWTKQGDKGLLTNHRIILDRVNGSILIIEIAQVKSMSHASLGKYHGMIQLPTGSDPRQEIEFSSLTESQRVYGLLRSAVLGSVANQTNTPELITRPIKPGATAHENGHHTASEEGIAGDRRAPDELPQSLKDLFGIR